MLGPLQAGEFPARRKRREQSEAVAVADGDIGRAVEFMVAHARISAPLNSRGSFLMNFGGERVTRPKAVQIAERETRALTGGEPLAAIDVASLRVGVQLACSHVFDHTLTQRSLLSEVERHSIYKTGLPVAPPPSDRFATEAKIGSKCVVEHC